MKTGNILLVFFLVFLIAGCSSSQPTVLEVKKTAEAEPNMVVIKNFAFKPVTLRIGAGTEVTWANADAAPHIIKSDMFESERLAQGQSWSHKFDSAGSYDYFCAIHPSMKGRVIVE